MDDAEKRGQLIRYLEDGFDRIKVELRIEAALNVACLTEARRRRSRRNLTGSPSP